MNAVIGAAHAASPPALDPAAILAVTKSGGGAASAATDNDPSSIAETSNKVWSFWEMELKRQMPPKRLA